MCKACLAGSFWRQHQFTPALTHVYYLQAFVGGSPSFEAVDGGLGSVGDVLLSIVGQGTLRYAMP